MSPEELQELIAVAKEVVEAAKQRGASVAEAIARRGSHLSTSVRLGAPELVEEAGSRSLGLRVMLKDQVAVTYTSDFSAAGRAQLVADAIELAQLSQSDPFAGPPDPSLLSRVEDHMELDTYDEAMDAIGAAEALEHALAGERAAREFDPRITNSEGGTFSRASGGSALVTSGGFEGSARGTYASLVVSPVADDEGGKKRSGYYWTARSHLRDLEADEAVGIEAAKRTLRQLGAKSIPSAQMPIVFDPDAGRSILGLLAGCIKGGAIWRKSSYLMDRLETQVASELVTIVDDPLMIGAPGSRAFDGEGLLSRKNVVVDKGVLRSYLLDTYAAKKLQMQSTASASRGGSGGVGISTSNFVLQPTAQSAEALLADTPRGLYVTSMMGQGFNSVTGDFSRGASGFLIEGGELTQAVSEVTISLNLDEILKRIDAIASDLNLRTATAAPTFRVSSMTVAGA